MQRAVEVQHLDRLAPEGASGSCFRCLPAEFNMVAWILIAVWLEDLGRLVVNAHLMMRGARSRIRDRKLIALFLIAKATAQQEIVPAIA